MDTEKVNNQFEKYFVYLAIFLLPILVLPSFPNAYVTPKLALITFVLGLVLIIKSVRSIMGNSVSFSASSFDLPVLLLGAIYIISSILQTPNKMEAYFLPGTATIMAAGVLLFFVVNQFAKKDKAVISYILFISAVMAALVILFAATGVFNSFASLPAYIKSTSFTPLGGPLPALIFLLALAPFGISFILNEDDIAKKAFFGIGFALVALAALLSLINVLPGKEGAAQLPGFGASWSVAVDSLKQSPLLGVGPGNYLTAFNRFRPISFNATDMSALRFTSGQSFLLTTITEAGLAGGAAMLIIVLYVARLTKTSKKATKDWLGTEGATLLSLLILTVSLLIFPGTPTLLFIFFVVLALASHTTVVSLGMLNSHSSPEKVPFAARIPVLVATLPVIIGVALYSYQSTRVLAADLTYKKALDSIVKNDGRAAYDTLQKTINTNPYVDRYRITYAQVNLALANSIAQKQEVSEEDRKTIAQLVQQAIREGKVAVALNPTRAGNWEVLASIYRAVMPLAQGADVFAAQTYAQAIALDPLNPNTRIALGGIYYAAKAYEDAIDVFKLAVTVKPDHANAHYNLAVAYRENGNLDRAIAEMGQVLALVDRNSDDYAVASKALEDMQNKKKAETPESSNLTAPPTGEEPGLEPPLELPEDAAPPQPEATPEATASPEAEASPTATILP